MSYDEPRLLLPRPPLVDVSGKTSIPTIVFYENEEIYIGDDAIEQCHDESLLHEDFKVAIGKRSLSSLVNKQIDRYGRTKRSPLGLTQDFMEVALRHVDKWLRRRDQATPSHVVVAEPIAMGSGDSVNDNWLQNYRAAIKRVLGSKFTVVDFLPEPFAAFQYYRHGLRHPLVMEKRQHTVLVADFGGGTFDACVIETDKDGDIRERGTSRSRPFSAFSRAVGGFYLNRLIAEDMLFHALPKNADKKGLKAAIERYYSFREGTDFSVEELRDDIRDFCSNYARFAETGGTGKTIR